MQLPPAGFRSGPPLQDANIFGMNSIRQQQHQQQFSVVPSSAAAPSNSISPSMLLQIWGGEAGSNPVRQAGNPQRSRISTSTRMGMPSPLDLSMLGGPGLIPTDCSPSFGLGGTGGSRPAAAFSSHAGPTGNMFGAGLVPNLGFGVENVFGGGILGSLDLQQQMQQRVQQQQQPQAQPDPHYPSSSNPGGFLFAQGSSNDLSTVEHDFEFSNLELVRPTRMNKVGRGHIHACRIAQF